MYARGVELCCSSLPSNVNRPSTPEGERAISIMSGTGFANTSVCTWAAVCCTITVYIWVKNKGVIE